MNSVPNSRRLPHETQPLAIQSNQTRFVALYDSAEASVTINFLDKLLSGRCFRPAVIDSGRLSATQAVEKVAATLDKKGHLLLCVHGGNVSNATGTGLGTHYAQFPDGDNQLISTEVLITRIVDQLGIKPLRVDRPAHGLPFIYLFSCHAGALRDQIRPDSDLWKRANLVIFAGKQQTNVLASGNAMAGAVSYIDHCQRTMQTVDPMKLMYFAGLRRGDCLTLMGGELSAPLVWHAPKSAHDQSRTDNLAGAPADLQRFAQVVSSLRAADYRLLPAASLTEIAFNRITRDDAEGLEALLKTHPELRDTPSAHGPSPLLFAAEMMAVGCLKCLLESGADPDQKDANGVTALMECVRYDSYSIECVDLLLTYDAHPDMQDANGRTALMFVCREGHEDAAKALLAQATNPNVQNEAGSTALMIACERGRHGTVQALLAHAADPNVRNTSGSTALMIACEKGHHEAVQALLAHAADPNVRNLAGSTALLYACEQGDHGSVQALLEHHADAKVQDQAGSTALIFACNGGHHGTVRALLAEGVDPDVQDLSGSTALIYACNQGHHVTVQALLADDADPNVQDLAGSTALIYACKQGHHDTVQALLAHAADPNVQNLSGSTALIYACENGHHGVAQALLAHAADPNLQNVDGWTALMCACLNGDDKTARALLASGANPDLQFNFGSTALIESCKEGLSDIARLLLDGGANPDLQDEDGITALMHAAALNDVASMNWLLANGARRDIVANDGRSCLAMVASDKRIELLQRLLAAGAGAPEGLNQTLVEHTRELGHPQAAALLEQALSAAENAS